MTSRGPFPPKTFYDSERPGSSAKPRHKPAARTASREPGIARGFWKQGSRAGKAAAGGAGQPSPVAFLHQSLALLLAGVLLAVVGLVQDLLGGRPPLEPIATHLLAGGFGAGVVELGSPLVLLIELWKEKQQLILTAFVCHISTTLDCLVEL